jgi:hypothetical protein
VLFYGHNPKRFAKVFFEVGQWLLGSLLKAVINYYNQKNYDR